MGVTPEIRVMTPADLDLALDWAAAEGWNPGIDDAACFRAADPNGFFMAYLDDEPVACISAVNYDETYAFIGCYICRPDQRGRSAAFHVARAGLAYAGDRVTGLDGVVERQENYRALGFEFAHRNIRYGGIVDTAPVEDVRLAGIDESLAPQIAAYDRLFNPAPRGAFLSCWLQPTRTRRGIACIEDGTVRGYGVIRGCRSGYKVGPLFADDADVAEALFRSLAADTGDETVYLDPPLPNEAAIAMAEKYGLTRVFETGRMYRGVAPSLPLDKIFGITTFELG